MDHTYAACDSTSQQTRARVSSEFWTEQETDYINSMLAKEATRPPILRASPQLEYRTSMVVCLEQASEKLGLTPRIRHAAVWLLDNYMAKYSIDVNELRAVAFVCLFAATKFEGVRGRNPSYLQICNAGDSEIYEPEKLNSIEFQILKNVNWDMTMPNAATFAEFYKRYFITDEDYNTSENRSDWLNGFSISTIDKKMNDCLSMILYEYNFCFIPPSLLAMACLMAARLCRGLYIWPAVYTKFCNFSRDDIYAVSLLITKNDFNLQYFD